MTKYFISKSKEITQGAIIKNLAIYLPPNEEGGIRTITLPYCIIISQACDISQSIDDIKYLPNIMILPFYILEIFQNGEHLKKCGYNNITQETFNNKQIKNLKSNTKNFRYHFLSKQEGIIEHDIITDFKHYYTLPKEIIINHSKENYICTIDSLYKELLSQRFCNYLGRIGLP